MDTKRPTKKQKKLLDFINHYTDKHGYSPSYREIASALGYSSTSTVALHINNLIDRGIIAKRSNSARSLEIARKAYKIDDALRGAVNNKYYAPAYVLLEVLADLEDDIKFNYEKGSVNQRALATLASLQGDLFSTYIVLLEKEIIISRATVLRAILENQGSILHIKGNNKRAEAYLNSTQKVQERFRKDIADHQHTPTEPIWSTSTIRQRVELIDDSATRLYDTLSDFVHGNNILDFYNTKQLTQAFVKAIDSYFIGLFIGFLAELGIGLEMDSSKRVLIFNTIEEIGKERKLIK